ncbi:kdo(2)-lipid IV(A) palmitoleoyltransferase [Enterobacillus tribolii]|uniref:Lipid A biosynthesis acyltransferase n=1 Tax=Enterobacillus tribolii TaxID=1487935 RepID=A0A370R501_9GAMM|nr:kdo(2)-lipid IV(A) palmitoleoyltransferase [Enterobacillus tribolii]MBW7983427.1 kdo(2)-lipid IV(A) palmitoleoyltransferase [Enterobacillus tribolii]RDK97486.1 KDO2-lipid IV(A) palmitoleoyltransferase [Enterobacillus tribolii]
MTQTTTFKKEFFHPRFFTTWFGLGVLYALVQLPYPWLYHLGHWMGKSAMYFMPRRVRIARQNLTLCFPDKSAKEIDDLVNDNFQALGVSLMETGIAWFWSDRRVRRWFTVTGLENMENACTKNQGVIVIGVHFMSLELGGRVMGLCRPMMAVYRPHNNQVLEYIQTKGRSRSNKAMLDRRNLKGIISALRKGEAVWFAPDQDYGPKGSTFAPFFAVKECATTNGTATIARLSQAKMLTTVLIRKPGAQGYELAIGKEIENYPIDDTVGAATFMNQLIEKEIMRAPEQYLWVHRRFKTQPAGSPSLYSL